MEKRKLGRTELDVSLIGFGGFHLLEISKADAKVLLNYYLDHGGNYVETAADYGNGESERKIGQVIKNRREEVVLASKTSARDKSGVINDVNRSLDNLKTDHLDLLFMHHVENEEELNKILSDGGALEGFYELKKQGKVRHLAISMHGQPDILIKALKTDHFDVVMATLNYFDKFNFPKLEDKLIPLAKEKNIGLICMKALADGFLYQSVEEAFTYAFSLPVDLVVTGMNTMEMLQEDLQLANNYKKMTGEDKEALYKNAKELNNYICRQCDECVVCPEKIDVKEIFKLEGYYDRQMRDGNPRNPAEFALRDRLRFWFQNQEMAKKLYEDVAIKANDCTDCGDCLSQCPYNLPIIKKLKIAHYKLGNDQELY